MPDRVRRVAGLTLLAGLATGVAGLLCAGAAVLGDADWCGAGTSLIASAASFGLLANAVLRT